MTFPKDNAKLIERLRELIAGKGDRLPTISERRSEKWIAELCDAASDAVSALTRSDEASAAGWRTMDSAPRDGTPCLIWQPDRKGEHYWGYDDARYAIGYWRVEGGWGDRNHAEVRPTHWQPLPAPPAPSAAAGEK